MNKTKHRLSIYSAEGSTSHYVKWKNKFLYFCFKEGLKQINKNRALRNMGFHNSPPLPPGTSCYKNTKKTITLYDWGEQPTVNSPNDFLSKLEKFAPKPTPKKKDIRWLN